MKRKLIANDTTINWNLIETEVAEDVMVSQNHICDLRTGFIEDGDVWIFGDSAQGLGAEGAKPNPCTKMKENVMLDIAKMMDTHHSRGKAVVARDIVKHVLDKHEILISKNTAKRAIMKMGLKWSPVKPAKRTYDAYRLKAIRDYLIRLDKYVKAMEGVAVIMYSSSQMNHTST